MADAKTCKWTELQPWRELILKGVSWSGFHDPATKCPEELGGFRYFRSIDEYYGVLKNNRFNAVRLTLYARGVLDNPGLNEQRCGRLGKDERSGPVHRYLHALHGVVDGLSRSGQLVMLDIHSLSGTFSVHFAFGYGCALPHIA